MTPWVISTFGLLACLIVLAIRWCFLERRSNNLEAQLTLMEWNYNAETNQRAKEGLDHLREVAGLKTQHEANLQAEKLSSARALTNFNEQCRKKLAEHDERIERIVKHLTTVDIARSFQSGKYRVSVDFDPDMLGGHFDRDDLLHLAGYMGDTVAREIASLKFVQNARGRNELYTVSRDRVPKPTSNPPGPVGGD